MSTQRDPRSDALGTLAAYDHDRALYELHKARMMLIAECRRQGATWDEIGQAMGITRQSAHELWYRSAGEVTARIREANRQAREEGR